MQLVDETNILAKFAKYLKVDLRSKWLTKLPSPTKSLSNASALLKCNYDIIQWHTYIH